MASKGRLLWLRILIPLVIVRSTACPLCKKHKDFVNNIFLIMIDWDKVAQRETVTSLQNDKLKDDDSDYK